MNKFFWAVRSEYSVDKFEGALTEAEKKWVLKKDDMERVFGISHAYMKDLKVFTRHLSVNDYVNVKEWIRSYMPDKDKPQVDVLVDSLLK